MELKIVCVLAGLLSLAYMLLLLLLLFRIAWAAEKTAEMTAYLARKAYVRKAPKPEHDMPIIPCKVTSEDQVMEMLR